MTKSFSISLVFLFVFAVFDATAADEKGKDTESGHCDCYTTKSLTCTDFLSSDDKIITIESECKDGYFITGFYQSAEKDPEKFGQYILIEKIKCCKPCQEK